MKHRIGIFFLILALLLVCVPAADADDAANDLTKACTITVSDGGPDAKKLQKSRDAIATFAAQQSFTVSWTDEVEPASVCVKWYAAPEAVSYTQYDADGRVLEQAIAPQASCLTVVLQAKARKVTVQASDAGMKVSYCCVYGAGALPEPFHLWLDTPDHLDYLLISTHPDDDVLYLGSVVPVYGAERGYVGSIAYVTCNSMKRMAEAENGAWTMGLRYRPLFLGFEDVPNGMGEAYRNAHFGYEDVLKGIVRTYRAYRPLVVFAQDRNGEYGHWQHMATSKAAVEALALAADATYDPESAAQYGTWQVQKVFLHLYEENRIVIDASSPLAAFDGKTAVEVAKSAFMKHSSQQGGSYTISADTGPLPLNLFGMAAGVVPVGDDAFDNIDETLFSYYVPPTPEPTEPPTPTPEPTEPPTPMPEPTEAPTGKPTEQPTAAPTPMPETEALADSPYRWLPFALPGLAAVLIAALVLIRIMRRRKS